MFREESEETSSVWEEKGSRGEKVKVRKIGGGEEGQRCKLTKSKEKYVFLW